MKETVLVQHPVTETGHGLPTAVPFALVTTGVGTASSDRNSVGTASIDRNSGHGLPMAVLLFGSSFQTFPTVCTYVQHSAC